MIEDDINSNQCRFCSSSFSDDILKKIKDDRNDVYCENCGDLIKRVQNKYNFNPTEIIEKTSNTKTNDTPTKPQKDLESNPDALHYPIGRIFYDKEFPLIFKSNFIIVFSRLTYFHALHLESKGQIELGGLEVPENAINNLFMSIRHIQNKRIKSEFLNNLHEISKEEFEHNLKQLQAKIQSNREYREDFIVYSRWLISKVYLLISKESNKDNLSKFDLTIYKDLENQKELFERKLAHLKNNSKKESKKMITARANFKINSLNRIKLLTVGYEKSELLTKIANIILDDALSGSYRLTLDDLPYGYKTNSLYIASVLIYYSLRHIEYNYYFPKYEIYGVIDYLKEFYPENITMKSAITKIIPKLYSFLSDSLKEKILYFPIKNSEINENIRKRVEEIKKLKRSEDFLSKLKKNICKFSNKLPDSIKSYNLALSILNDALEQPNQFSYQSMLENSRWFSTPKFYAIPFLFFAYNHEDFKASNSLNISDFSDRFFDGYKKSNQAIISFIFKYLSTKMKEKIQYKPKEIYDPKEAFNEYKMWEYFNNMIGIFIGKNHELYFNRAKKLYKNAISKGFNTNSMITKHPRYLATTLVYFILLMEEEFDISKKELINKLKINGHPLENFIYKVMKHFSQYVDIKQKISKYDELAFKEKLLKIYNYNEEISRGDNLILMDLIMSTLEFYENQFEKLITDFIFISNKKKTSAILEKLANANVFNKEVNLMNFISGYERLINNLQIENQKKEKLNNLLSNFENARKKFYKYEERKTQKILRERKRYSEYGDAFYSMENRIKRFVLMLGFTPYDGFDIWGNKIRINGIFRIFANFHHYHYNPEDKSYNDLVFIPVKPPKEFQKNGMKFLSHNMIAGREGNLKRNDISSETKQRNIEELKIIEERIGYNSNLIEKAVLTLNSEFLDSLKGWETESIERIKKRLKDQKFAWTKGIEEYIPTAKGHKNERISAKNTEKIIQEIIKSRV